MKSIVFLSMVTTLILDFQNSNAQVLVGPVAGTQIGVTSFSDKSYKNFYKQSPFIGYHAGVSLSWRMQKRIYLQTHILYSRKGRVIIGKADETFENSAHYNYLDFPILFTKEFKMRLGKNRYYNIYLGAGPTLSYWLSGGGVLKGSELNENLINPPDYTLKYKVVFRNNPEADTIRLGEMNVANANRLQLGFNVVAGVVFEPARFNRFMFTVRYEMGHSYMSPESDGDFGDGSGLFYKDDMQSRFQSLALSLYYFIDLKTDERNRGKSTIKLDKIKRK